MEFDLAQIVSQILAFLIMVWILKRYAWQPLLSVMQTRQNKIAEEFSAIESAKKELKSLQEEYKTKLKTIEVEAHSKFQAEIAKASRVAEEIHQKALQDAKETLKRAEEEIGRETIKARNSLKKEMIDLILLSTEKILNEKMKNPAEQKAYISSLLEEAKL